VRLLNIVRPTTAKIVAMRALERTCGQECVDWAISLLEQGISTRNVTILAGMMAPFNHFEMAEQRDRVLHELGAPQLTREEAISAYAGELAAETLTSDGDVFQLVSELAQLCIAEDYPAYLYDFYLLHNAWWELLARNIQWYLPDATRDNIETLVRDHLVAFAARAKLMRNL
jgi:hypothetical protein